MRILERRVTHRLSAHVACAELSARDSSPAAEMLVMQRQVHVRKSCAAMQRSETAAVVYVDVGLAEAPAIPPIPRMETVTRSQRQPADRAPAIAESVSETPAVTEERNISRRPDRAVKRIRVNRTRPPGPRVVIHHPATVVIRSPAPGIIRNPGPSPIRLVHPSPVAIRRPIIRHIRTPHLTVIRNVRPGAMIVEIFGTYVVVVSASPRCRIADDIVAIGVPLVPVIPCRRFADLVLRLLAQALHGNELALPDARSALWSRNFYFAFADEHFSMIVSSNQNSEAGFAAIGANGNVGCIDFCVRIAVLQDGVVRHPASKLNLDLRASERIDIRLRMLRQAKHVGEVELKFSARFVTGRNAVPRKDRGIERSRGPVASIAALCGDIAMNQTDASNAGISFNRRAGALNAALIVIARLRRTLIHRTLVVRALVDRTLVHRTLVRGALVVGTLDGRFGLDARRRFRILIRRLVVRVLSNDGARNRHRQSQS